MSAEAEEFSVPTPPPRRWFSGMPSPNPGGRPKAQHRVQELAREHTEDAINKLLALMNDPKSSRMMQLAAANALLDRAWGKPAQTILTPDVDTSTSEVDDFTLARHIAFLFARATAVSPGLTAISSAEPEKVSNDA